VHQVPQKCELDNRHWNRHQTDRKTTDKHKEMF